MAFLNDVWQFSTHAWDDGSFNAVTVAPNFRMNGLINWQLATLVIEITPWNWQ
jgi:hypothetical protein